MRLSEREERLCAHRGYLVDSAVRLSDYREPMVHDRCPAAMQTAGCEMMPLAAMCPRCGVVMKRIEQRCRRDYECAGCGYRVRVTLTDTGMELPVWPEPRSQWAPARVPSPELIAERLAVMRAFHLVNVQRSMNRAMGNTGGALAAQEGHGERGIRAPAVSGAPSSI